VSPAPGFRPQGEELIYRGEVISLAMARFVAPDGHGFEREIVRHPGAVSVVPLLGDGATVLLLRQFRAPIGTTILEIPAGKRDVDGEAPEATAARELEEEVGMRAGRLEQLAEFYNSPGFSDERSFTYLGLDLEPCTTAFQGVEESHMTVEEVALGDVPALIARGAIVDAKTIIGLCLARERLAVR
jgi:8-oxo-dGTP pyrophosphatase MutT (NUDIX family)